MVTKSTTKPQSRRAKAHSSALVSTHNKIAKSAMKHGEALAQLDNASELHAVHHYKAGEYGTKQKHDNACKACKELAATARMVKASAMEQMRIAEQLEKLAEAAARQHEEAGKCFLCSAL